MIFFENAGNGKRHRIPTPEGLKKIKRISFETFLNLKELLKEFNPNQCLNRKNRNRFKKPLISNRKQDVTKKLDSRTYEPTQITNTRDSLFWQWRRVIAWERYINDPLDRKK